MLFYIFYTKITDKVIFYLLPVSNTNIYDKLHSIFYCCVHLMTSTSLIYGVYYTLCNHGNILILVEVCLFTCTCCFFFLLRSVCITATVTKDDSTRTFRYERQLPSDVNKTYKLAVRNRVNRHLVLTGGGGGGA